MSLIYIADDEKHICHMIERQLVVKGYQVESFCNGKELLDALQSTMPDLIITDIMMPLMDGYELCREIRKISQIPIIMLSAKSEEVDRIQGLELGSDDYIGKPFSLKELSIKVTNMINRYQYTTDKNESIELSCKDLVIDVNAHTIHVNRVLLNLTEKEYDFLVLLVTNKNQAFSRQDIIEKIYGFIEDEDTRLLDHLVKRIRKKLYACNSVFEIKTIWGYGYKVGDL